MEPIKISVDVNLNVSDDAKSFFIALFSNALSNNSSGDLGVSSDAIAGQVKIVPVTTAVNTETKKTVATTSKATVTAGKATEKATTAVVEDKVDTDETVSIEVLREILAEKINDNRVVIKEKLTEYGCKSISTLDPSKYSEMWNFLNEL